MFVLLLVLWATAAFCAIRLFQVGTYDRAHREWVEHLEATYPSEEDEAA